jgi:hypothetical protein
MKVGLYIGVAAVDSGWWSCGPKARIPVEQNPTPENCRLIWKLTSGMQPIYIVKYLLNAGRHNS